MDAGTRPATRARAAALVAALTTAWVGVAASFVPAPAFGDWLKTRDGALIETEGAWEVRGAMVVFTLPGGTLSSMRLSQIDLEASREATAAAQAPPPPPPAQEPAAAREPVLVVTNKDIPRAVAPLFEDADAGEAAPAASGASSSAPPEAARQEPVEVVAWRQIDGVGVDGVEIHGTVRNQGRDIVMNVRVRVVLLDEDDQEIAAANAFLGSPSLAPTITTTFRALFPSVFRFETPRFEVRSQAVQVREIEAPESEEGP